jgi:hypothetical protein
MTAVADNSRNEQRPRREDRVRTEPGAGRVPAASIADSNMAVEMIRET